MFCSCCSLDGSPFHKSGAVWKKAICEKSGELSVSLYTCVSVLLLVYLLMWITLYLSVCLYMAVWVIHNNLYFFGDIFYLIFLWNFPLHIFLRNSELRFFWKFVNCSVWCINYFVDVSDVFCRDCLSSYFCICLICISL